MEYKDILLKKLDTYKDPEQSAGKVFDPFLDVLCQIAEAHLETGLSEGTVHILYKGWLNRNVLKGLLLKVSRRVLIYDMNVRKAEGMLHGTNEEEEYQDYVFHYLMKPEYLIELFKTYSEWEKNLWKTIKFFVRNISDILEHLSQDKKDLNALLFQGNPFNKIKAVFGSGSDTHCKNKMVYRVELDNGEVLYYKPRANEGLKFYNELYDRISIACGLPVSFPSFLIGGNYTWERETGYRECESTEQVKNYFRRLGIILCICQLCHTSDMHYENMIADGEFPVLIDHETLIQIPNMGNDAETGTMDTVLAMSVLTIGLLPFFSMNTKGMRADFSGLSGDGGQVLRFKVPVIENPGKSNMGISYAFAKTREQKNRVRFKGEPVEPSEYTEQISEGFQMAYTYILENKTEMCKSLQNVSEAKFRHLFRNTQEYQMILDLSYHPEFMKEAGKREDFLREALSIPAFKDRSWILEQEIQDMLNGDIPYFQFKMSDRRVMNSEGVLLEDYFPLKGLEFMENQIQGRSEEDMRIQEQFIQVALNFRKVKWLKDAACLPEKTKKLDRKLILELCSKIADEICSHQILIPDGPSWMNTSILPSEDEERFTYHMEASDMYLYEGIMGIAVFAAALRKWLPGHKISELYKEITDRLFEYTKKVCEDSNQECVTGAFCGESSIVYGYQILYKLTKHPVFLDYAQEHCQVVFRNLEKDENYDIVSGNGGALLVFLNMYEMCKDKKYLEMAEKAGEFLVRHAVPQKKGTGWQTGGNGSVLCGFAHGNSGIMYGLAKLAGYTKKKKYLDTAYQAFLYEREWYLPEKGGWRDFRSDDERYTNDFKWCHGSGGIILSRKLSSPYFDGDRRQAVEEDAKQLIKGIPHETGRRELGLCHGSLGNLLLTRLSGIAGGDKMTEASIVKILNILGSVYIEETPPGNIYEQYDYGLMTGIAGIGYGLLCCMDSGMPIILDLVIK